MAPPGVPVVEPAPPPWAPPASSTAVAKTKPPGSSSWLPDDMEDLIPNITPRQTPRKIFDTAPPVGTVPPPVWLAGKRKAAIRRIVSIVAIAALVLIAIGSGAWALRHYGFPKLPSLTASHSPAVLTPSPVVSPSPTIAKPFTAQITGSPCPGAHVGDPACLSVSFTNTGPDIGNLAMVFITDPPYSNWFEHHFGAGLYYKDTANGCSIDSIHLEVVCGRVPSGTHIIIHLIGYMANIGTHTFGVKFVDISSGSLSDVNLRADGTPFVIEWSETVT